MQNIKTLFIGTSWQSVEILKTLHMDSRFEIVGVITQPDKPVGRKQILTPSEVKEYGTSNNIPVYITESKEERYKEALEIFKPELIVCIAFGEIMPEFFLNAPKYGSINIHFSILPKYRGAVPIQMAILNGESETGVSVMKMSAGMDEGDVLAIYKTNILPEDTNQTLRERLVEISKEKLPEVLEKWVKGEITAVVQDDTQATYCYEKNMKKENMEISFEKQSAEVIDRMVRASIPWPVAWAMIEGKRVKIYKVRVLDVFNDLKAGERLEDRLRMVYGTQDKQIEILELQPEGKTVMSAAQYLSGRIK